MVVLLFGRYEHEQNPNSGVFTHLGKNGAAPSVYLCKLFNDGSVDSLTIQNCIHVFGMPCGLYVPTSCVPSVVGWAEHSVVIVQLTEWRYVYIGTEH